MKINIVTIFPRWFDEPLGTSIPGRARAAGLVDLTVVDLREYTHDRHRTVDDYPFGGGAGMVMKPEPFFEAVDALAPQGPVILLSARGKRFRHEDAVRLSLEPEITLLCGHYKDVDQRVADGLATQELSLGDFVLSGGELAAMAVIDAVVRQLPGALGDGQSAAEESFAQGLLDCPQYTRPETYAGERVPEVLLSGHHEQIRRWRLKQSLGRTWLRRPELIAGRTLGGEEQGLLEEFKQETKNGAQP